MSQGAALLFRRWVGKGPMSTQQRMEQNVQSNQSMRVDPDDQSSLAHLRALIDKLPPVPFERLAHPINGNRVTLTLTRGACLLTGLYAAPDMSVAMAVVEAGSQMAPHTHDQTEFFIVVAGGMVAHFDGRTVTAGPGEQVIIPCGVSHWVEWPEATKALVATIPQSPGFPHA